MKKIWIAVGRFVYGTWYGAMVVFVAVTVLLHGLFRLLRSDADVIGAGRRVGRFVNVPVR